jgi:hypothetical protein
MALAIKRDSIIAFSHVTGGFPIVRNGHAIPIYVDSTDWPGVARAAKDLQSDIAKVTRVEPNFHLGKARPTEACLVIGTLGKSDLIDDLVKRGKLDATLIQNKLEATISQVVENPWPGVHRAFVIAGSDKRGSIYGTYTLSEEAGVSPWYWWADVPVQQHQELYARPGVHFQNSPAVKYRGIFINDEAPSLTNWVHEKFGNYNHKFYEKVFELLLRLKANCLWPAMWDNCFSEDDPLNPKLADEYGIVMGTSHVEPMMRADKEWNREGYSPDAWNYLTHPKELEDFWTRGIERNKPYESIVTVGMRGKIDTPMSETANVQLLEKIVAAQRQIIADHLNKNLEKVPQVWCLYKEVQDYYEKGMRVPDDVTLLWADDNWGNIRRLPTLGERNRKGGAGVYYHFDYVGGPRNYKWLNTVQIERVWEQMHLAYTSGAKQIWIVNVGSMKVKEFPMEFFMRYAWDPASLDASDLKDYTVEWAARQFGDAHAAEIGELIETYTKYNARRKPELLSPDTYTLTNYNEAETVVQDYNNLARRAEALEHELPENCRAAYYELVEHPILACANLNDLYVSAGKNQLYAAQGRFSANWYAGRVKELFGRDQELQTRFHTMLGGKWNHMMDQTHIGYTSWQQPDTNTMPELHTVSAASGFGVAVEGGGDVLPEISAYGPQRRWIDVFSRGAEPFSGTVTCQEPWLTAHREPLPGGDVRFWVSADWNQVPAGITEGQVVVSQGAQTFSVRVPIQPRVRGLHGFVEDDGYVAIEAPHFDKAINGADAYWKPLPNLGKTGGAVTVFPPTGAPQDPERGGMRLEYKVYLFSKGPLFVDAYLSPTQLLWPTGGLKYGISVDDEPPQIVNIHRHYTYFTPSWEKSVADNIIVKQTSHKISGPGYHTVKFWAVDSGVVLQRLVIDTGGVRKSYLGPPESVRLP